MTIPGKLVQVMVLILVFDPSWPASIPGTNNEL